MILAAHQPQYLPWLGYFHKMDQADVFVLLDNVQYKKNEWQNRNRIKTVQGWQWLTVPVLYKFPEWINQVRINNRVDWCRKHFQALITNYSRAPFFGLYRDFFEETYRREWEMLVDLNLHLIRFLAGCLGITTELRLASDYELSQEPNRRLIELCKLLGADTYLAGQGGRDYMDLVQFEQAGVKVVFQEFNHPVYGQLYGDFLPFMSVVDLLFNQGLKSLEILRGASEEAKGV